MSMSTVSVDVRRPVASDGDAATTLPPVDTRFTLGRTITGVQRRFLDRHGFLVFAKVATVAEVGMIGDELDRIEREWIATDRRTVNGIPLFWGKNEGRPYLQRFPFTSTFSEPVRDLVRDGRFAPIRDLVGAGARIGDNEKDGVVVNRYVNVPGSVHPRLGWHTDGLRDLFYLRMPKPMLNIGLHLDRCPADNGGLRLIPGSHTQGFFSMCFRKPYFVSHRPDPAENRHRDGTGGPHRARRTPAGTVSRSPRAPVRRACDARCTCPTSPILTSPRARRARRRSTTTSAPPFAGCARSGAR